jgi:hypothetical protein
LAIVDPSQTITRQWGWDERRDWFVAFSGYALAFLEFVDTLLCWISPLLEACGCPACAGVS